MIVHTSKHPFHLQSFENKFDIALFFFMTLSIVLPAVLFIFAVISLVIYTIVNVITG
jgi:hypothetical protein